MHFQPVKIVLHGPTPGPELAAPVTRAQIVEHFGLSSSEQDGLTFFNAARITFREPRDDNLITRTLEVQVGDTGKQSKLPRVDGVRYVISRRTPRMLTEPRVSEKIAGV